MDERTVYLYARHNGANDKSASEFVDWFYASKYDSHELNTAFLVWNLTVEASDAS